MGALPEAEPETVSSDESPVLFFCGARSRGVNVDPAPSYFVAKSTCTPVGRRCSP